MRQKRAKQDTQRQLQRILKPFHARIYRVIRVVFLKGIAFGKILVSASIALEQYWFFEICSSLLFQM